MKMSEETNTGKFSEESRYFPSMLSETNVHKLMYSRVPVYLRENYPYFDFLISPRSKT